MDISGLNLSVLDRINVVFNFPNATWITIKNSRSIFGSIIAPKANIDIVDSRIYGFVVAKNLKLLNSQIYIGRDSVCPKNLPFSYDCPLDAGPDNSLYGNLADEGETCLLFNKISKYNGLFCKYLNFLFISDLKLEISMPQKDP